MDDHGGIRGPSLKSTDLNYGIIRLSVIVVLEENTHFNNLFKST